VSVLANNQPLYRQSPKRFLGNFEGILQSDGYAVPIRDYLCSILPGLANFPINRIAERTPAAWLAQN
jgi:hypothetical protein